MRTTIEIPDSQRSRLLALAAERGEKGFSKIVQEALERYLAESPSRAEIVKRALGTRGTLSEAEADRMRESVRRSRANWR